MTSTRAEEKSLQFNCSLVGKTVGIGCTYTVFLDRAGAEKTRLIARTTCDYSEHCPITTHMAGGGTSTEWSKCKFVKSG